MLVHITNLTKLYHKSKLAQHTSLCINNWSF